MSTPNPSSERDVWTQKQELAKPSRYYGDGGTIHSSRELDIEVNDQGEVVAVWFRCQMLAFRQAEARQSEVTQGAPLTGVEVLDEVPR